MESSLQNKLKDLDKNGYLEPYKTAVHQAVNVSFDVNNISSSNSGGFTTWGSGVGNTAGYWDYQKDEILPYIWPHPTPPYVPPAPDRVNVPYTGGTDTIFDFGKKTSAGAELGGMLIEGKDLIDDKKEFLEKILKLPSVDGNNLKAIEVLERLRKLAIILGVADPEKKNGRKRKSGNR